MKRLYRSTRDKKLAGICGGLGEYLNADSNLIRLIFVLLFFFTGFVPAALTYIVAWFILPEDTMVKGASEAAEQPEKEKPKKRVSRKKSQETK